MLGHQVDLVRSITSVITRSVAIGHAAAGAAALPPPALERVGGGARLNAPPPQDARAVRFRAAMMSRLLLALERRRARRS